MKKLFFTFNAGLLLLFAKGQYSATQFIDSVAENINPSKTIVLFTELRDTINILTGKTHTQRTSYYFDWHNKELRYIEVYDFDKAINWRAAEKAFRKQKRIPSSTRTVYTFSDNNLIKVKFEPSKKRCQLCSGEYYFINGTMIFKNEINIPTLKTSFVDKANVYFTRLRLTKRRNDVAYQND